MKTTAEERCRERRHVECAITIIVFTFFRKCAAKFNRAGNRITCRDQFDAFFQQYKPPPVVGIVHASWKNVSRRQEIFKIERLRLKKRPYEREKSKSPLDLSGLIKGQNV